jgi:hypothetical protein
MASSLDGLGPHVPLSTQIMVETLPRLGDVLTLPDQPDPLRQRETSDRFQARKSSARHERRSPSRREPGYEIVPVDPGSVVGPGALEPIDSQAYLHGDLGRCLTG